MTVAWPVAAAVFAGWVAASVGIGVLLGRLIRRRRLELEADPFFQPADHLDGWVDDLSDDPVQWTLDDGRTVTGSRPDVVALFVVPDDPEPRP